MEEGCYCCELFLNLDILLPFREVGVRRRVWEARRNKDAFREIYAIFLKQFMMSCHPEAERRTVLLEEHFAGIRVWPGQRDLGSAPGSGVYWLPGSRCFTGPLWVSRSSLVEPGNWLKAFQLAITCLKFWPLDFAYITSRVSSFSCERKIRNSSWS